MAKQGDVIDGKYKLLEEIGHGGMSTVWLARDTRLNKQWAVKEVKRTVTDKGKEIAVQSLLSEANLMITLDHPALPRITAIIEEGEKIYVVMDFIEGEPLDKVLKIQGAQTEKAVIEWGKQLANVLDYLHRRQPPIIYRDMKPANIMLKPEDGTVKLFDFGIAREYKVWNTTDTTVLGTPGYAAPEQYDEEKQTDARTDIFGLGATLHHLVTGEKPPTTSFERKPINKISKYSEGLDYIIQKCTEREPEDRYQSCAEVLFDLENIEIIGKTYRDKQKKKLIKFIVSVAMTLAMAILGTGTLIGYKMTLSQTVKETINLYGMNSAGGGDFEELSESIQTYGTEISDETAEELISNYKGVFTDKIEQLANECSDVMENNGMTDEKKKELDESEKKMFNNMDGIVNSLKKELKDLKPEIKDDIYYFAGDIYLNYYKCSEGKLDDTYIKSRNEEASMRFSNIRDDYDEEVLAYTERVCNVSNVAKMFRRIDAGVSDNENVISEKDITDAWKTMKEAIDGKDGEDGEQRYSNRVNLYLIIGNITYEQREVFRMLSDEEEENVKTKNEIISFCVEAVDFLKDDTKVQNVKSSSVESINSKRQKAIIYFEGIYEALALKRLEG